MKLISSFIPLNLVWMFYFESDTISSVKRGVVKKGLINDSYKLVSVKLRVIPARLSPLDDDYAIHHIIINYAIKDNPLLTDRT